MTKPRWNTQTWFRYPLRKGLALSFHAENVLTPIPQLLFSFFAIAHSWLSNELARERGSPSAIREIIIVRHGELYYRSPLRQDESEADCVRLVGA